MCARSAARPAVQAASATTGAKYDPCHTYFFHAGLHYYNAIPARMRAPTALAVRRLAAKTRIVNHLALRVASGYTNLSRREPARGGSMHSRFSDTDKTCGSIPRPSVSSSALLRCIDRISYGDALRLQLDLHARCAAGEIPGALVLLEHQPVITMGVRAAEANVLVDEAALNAMGIELARTDRGGDVTYHGPGQLVGYPIVRLRELAGDLHAYLRMLEETVIVALSSFGLRGERSGPAGVWVEGRKVCSIGVAVRKWVSYHGFALNVNPDMSHFALINPCGLASEQITSIARLTGRAPEMSAVREVCADAFARVFGVTFRELDGDLP